MLCLFVLKKILYLGGRLELLACIVVELNKMVKGTLITHEIGTQGKLATAPGGYVLIVQISYRYFCRGGGVTL